MNPSKFKVNKCTMPDHEFELQYEGQCIPCLWSDYGAVQQILMDL